MFSVTKSIVSLLVGIAIDEGYIKSIEESIANYLPVFNREREKKITIKNLLTMSSGLSWDEAYSSLFSVTTQGYYGDNIKETVMKLHSIAERESNSYTEAATPSFYLSLLKRQREKHIGNMLLKNYGNLCRLPILPFGVRTKKMVTKKLSVVSTPTQGI